MRSHSNLLVLLRSGIPNGINLYQRERSASVEKTGTLKGLKKLYVDSLENLNEGETYFTKNGNKLFKISEEEIILVSIQSGVTVHIPIIGKYNKQTLVPVLLDRRFAIDPTVQSTAEAVIEDLTGETLYTGIPLIDQSDKRGKVVFSLKELPLDILFLHDKSKTTIMRTIHNQFLINSTSFDPAKEEHLLCGTSVNSLLSPTISRFTNNSPNLPNNVNNKSNSKQNINLENEEEEEEEEEEDEYDIETYIEHHTSIAFRKFFIGKEGKINSNSKVEINFQNEQKKRLLQIMQKYDQFYNSNNNNNNENENNGSSKNIITPMYMQGPLDHKEEILFNSNFVKLLKQFLSEKDKKESESKTKDHFNQFLTKYQDVFLEDNIINCK